MQSLILRNVPKYLLPRGMQVANQTRRKRRRRNNNNYNKGVRRTDNDPLQSYDGENINLDNVDGNNDTGNGGGINDSEFDDPLTGVDDAADDYDDNVTNKSTAGRARWQERHKRGKFSKKFQKKQKDQIGF